MIFSNCGICHSGLHQIKNYFGGTIFPIVPGHEVVGRVTRVGDHVSNFEVGELTQVELHFSIRFSAAEVAELRTVQLALSNAEQLLRRPLYAAFFAQLPQNGQ